MKHQSPSTLRITAFGIATALVMAAAASAHAGSVSITHDAIGCVVADKFARIDAVLQPADQVSRARTYFRAAGTAGWYYVEMKRQAQTFSAHLPKPKTSTVRIEYYVEALDAALGASRTAEHSPRVVDVAGGCSNEVVAPLAGTARITVGAPPGAPALPPGFASTGLVALAAAGQGGISTATLGIAAGGAAAVTGGVLVAHRGGEGAQVSTAPAIALASPTPIPTPTPPPTCTPGQLSISFRWEPETSRCPKGALRSPYRLAWSFTATNRSSVAVALGKITGVVTCSPSSAAFQCSRGPVFSFTDQASNIDMANVPAGATVTAWVPLNPPCSNTAGAGGAYADSNASMTFETSCGTVEAQQENAHRLTLE